MYYSPELLIVKDSPDFIDVGANQIGTTSEMQECPVVKTLWLSYCAALVLYDPKARVGTLAHINPSVFLNLPDLSLPDHEGTVDVAPDKVLQELNKLFYSLKNNGSLNATEANRGKLETWVVCAYDILEQRILSHLGQMGVNTEQAHVFTNGISAVALDTRQGKLFGLRRPYFSSIGPNAWEIAPELGILSSTLDRRSLK